ncbi:MarR family winged helix-turn-helix transcriptional regulator [Nocardia pseudobrasiliensis]|uniref:MarR family transcriptional regulator n=1 Tax=Nocardia pseudobrasiliensis TaxID=45979 RepID=A0A370IG30_9NOCA|nr:MarR family winged helix-turn-helix transcriptional regulator [Nocardia pseudobrasiliensis]RDI68414.1 MarR family transcriptional regulator [Nocardia pseudobrasiliensis]
MVAPGESENTEQTSRWGADEMRAWWSFVFTSRLLFDRLDVDLRRGHGLTLDEYGILVALEAAPDARVRMNDLAEAALHSQSRLSQQIKRMQARGLVDRQRAATDKRGVEVMLTETGRELLLAVTPAHIDRVRRYFLQHLSTHDRVALAASLRPALNSLATSPTLIRMLEPVLSD